MFIFPLARAAATDDKIFYLDLIFYRNGTVLLKDFKSQFGTVTNFLPEPIQENDEEDILSYSVIMLSKDSKTLFKGYFGIGFRAGPLPLENETGYDVQLNQREQFIRLPFLEDAKTIQFFHLSSLIFEYEIPTEETPGKKGPEIPWIYVGAAALLATILVVYLIRKNYTIKL